MWKGECQVVVEGSKQVLDCRWEVQSYTTELEPELGRALCVVLTPLAGTAAASTDPLRLRRPATPKHPEGAKRLRQPHDFQSFLIESLETTNTNSVTRFAFVLPTVDGYVVRSDFVKRRLVGSDAAKSVAGFLEPLQLVKAVGNDTTELRKIMESSVAGILLRDTVAEADSFRPILDELADRLSFPWLAKQPIPRRRLVWVGGRYAVTESENIWDAAYSLGISLIIIDETGNWLEKDSSPHAYYREAFVRMDITADEGFIDRLRDTVQNLQKTMKIDGIMASTDARLAKGALVCEMLGLPTSPSASYEISTNKAKVRMLEADTGGACVFSDYEEFQKLLQTSGLPKDLEYPLVVKPCMGWASECVTKVNDQQELVQAALKASNRHAAGPLRQAAFMVERYANGPEFDANVILHDGKIVFFELGDDFPSGADRPDASSHSNFMETENMTPSALPDRERQIVQDSVHRSILRLGYSSGTFLCEGRVLNSSMRYNFKSQWDGDLEPVSDEAELAKTPSVFLHEINARTPAYICCTAAQVTYGVDFYALQQLYSVGDMERFSYLAQQFRNGPQWHCAYVYFLPERDGIMKTPDTTQQLIDNNSDVRHAIVANHTIIRGGQKVFGPTSSELSFLGWILVASKVSRAECLRLARVVRERFQFELE